MNNRCRKLFEKAQQSRHNFAFDDLMKLAKCAGFEEDGGHSGGGSHRILSRPTEPYTLNVQPGKSGQAKPAQVRQLVKIIIETGGDL